MLKAAMVRLYGYVRYVYVSVHVVVIRGFTNKLSLKQLKY